MNSRTIISVLSLFLTAPGLAKGGEPRRTLTAREALGLAVRHNAGLRAALLAEDRADAQVVAEEGRYPFVFQADTGYTHSSSPAVAPTGGIVHHQRDDVTVGAGVSKTLPLGTVASVDVAGSRQVSRGSVSGIAVDRDPAYGLTTTLSMPELMTWLREQGVPTDPGDGEQPSKLPITIGLEIAAGDEIERGIKRIKVRQLCPPVLPTWGRSAIGGRFELVASSSPADDGARLARSRPFREA